MYVLTTIYYTRVNQGGQYSKVFISPEFSMTNNLFPDFNLSVVHVQQRVT